MSYLLDALKKATTVNSNEPKLSKDNLEKQLRLSDTEPSNSRKLPKALASYVLLAFAFILGGFVLGDGADLIVHYQTDLNANEIDMVETVREEALIPFYGTMHDSAKFFSDPEAYNKKLFALRTKQAQQLKNEIIAKQKAEEKANKRLMEQQIKSLLSQKSIQQAMVANQTANISTEKQRATDTTAPVKFSLNKDELAGVSPELLEAFESALDDTNNPLVNEELEEPVVDLSKRFIEPDVDLRKPNTVPVKPLSQMPQWLQNEVPSLHFSLHMYTSDVASSWVRLNGKDYYTGGITKDGLVIEAIQPQTVVLQFQGQRFSLKALSSW